MALPSTMAQVYMRLPANAHIRTTMRAVYSLVAIATVVQADTLANDAVRTAVNQFYSNVDLRLRGTTITAACNALGGDEQQSGNITDNWETLKSSLNNEICPNSSSSYHGEACNGQCCASYSTSAYAGQYCIGSYCAFAGTGHYSGTKCVGYRCAASSTSGCPPLGGANLDSCASCSPTFTNNEYSTCCAANQGAACVGEECSYLCNGQACGSYCLRTGCAANCTGTSCGSWCQGETCSANCTGNACGSQCWGKQCAINCIGPACGSGCTLDHCAHKCDGSTCGQYCVGKYCGAECDGVNCANSCIGDHCAENCTGPAVATADDGESPCGVLSVGNYSARYCQGHGCGKHCTGKWCAAYASSIYTTSDVITNISNPVMAVSCWNEWLARAMGIPRSELTSAAPTAAPTVAPTGARRRRDLTSAPTSDRYRRTADDDDTFEDAFDNTTCKISSFLDMLTSPDLDIAVEGPGHHCNGFECAISSVGAFAGTMCNGEHCARYANGLFAGAGCVGHLCGKDTKGTMASSFCYGKWCAQNANGTWAGSFCIGNECAYNVVGQQSGWCCVGLNCSADSNIATCTDESFAGTPMSLGASNLYSPDCRRVVDTDSAEWKNFSDYCGGGTMDAIAAYKPSVACTIQCTSALSSFLRFYQTRLNGEVYGTQRAKYSIRWQHYQAGRNVVDNTNKDYETATIVLGAVVGAAVLAGAAYGLSRISSGEQFQYGNIRGQM